MKWILGTIGLLVLGLVLQLGLLVYAMYVLLGILALSRFFSRSWIDQLAASRVCNQDMVEIGGTAVVEIEVRNPGRRSVPWLIIEDSLPREVLVQIPQRIKTEGPRLMLTRLAPGESATLKHQVTFLRRGYYQLGPLLLETGDVFGLHRRFRVATEPHFVLVPPKVLPLQGYNLASRRPIGEIRVMHRLFEDPTRLASIRPYQAGDPLNRIHWRATARTGEIHCRVYENSRVAGATFLLDFHDRSYSGSGASPSAELAIVTVASLAHAVFLLGQQIGFASNGRDAADRIREEGWGAGFTTRTDAHRRAAETPANTRLRPVIVKTRKGGDRFAQILETLARLEHTDGLEFSGMLAEVASEIPRDATVVAVLRRVTPATAAALGELARRGFLVTVIVVSIELEPTPDWAQPPDWAQMLLAHNIDFRIVNTEEAVMNLCAEAIVR
jgi:uncharacterized protein (DUF58 family)